MKFPLPVQLMSYTQDSFQGKDGNNIHYASAIVRVDGEMYLFKALPNLPLDKYLDQDIKVIIEIKPSTRTAVNAKIVGLQ